MPFRGRVLITLKSSPRGLEITIGFTKLAVFRNQELIKYLRALEGVVHALGETGELSHISCDTLDPHLERKLTKW